jgi:hypothetical protein
MTTPGNTPTGSTVGTTWADNMSLDTFVQALSNLPDAAVIQQQASDPQRFWSTPERPATSTTQEVMQVTLASPRLLNEINFDVAIFPQIVTVQYYDDEIGAWVSVLDSTTDNAPLTATLLDSFPTVLPPVTNVTGQIHPQHSFSGHWRTLFLSAKPFTARLIRLVLQRTTQGTPPVNVFGQKIDYSLAIRNFYIGYQVSRLGDIPRTNPSSTFSNQSEDFASATDLLGSIVNFSVRVNSAENVLRNSPSNPGGIAEVIWKCEPQPFPWAVVNFYADTRDDSGNPQVIDQFYVEPLYDGPSCHLYWSNDQVTLAFVSATDPLPYPVAIVQDPNGLGGDVLRSGAQGRGLIAFVDLDNTVFDFDPSRAWWIGASLNFKFAHGTENFDSPIFDCGAFNIALTPFGMNLTTQFGDTLAIDIGDFDVATPMKFIASYDGVDTVTLNAQVAATTYSGTAALPVPLTGTTAATLRVGGFLESDPRVGNFDLNSLVIKIDTDMTDDLVTNFFVNPDAYIVPAQFEEDEDPRTDNALLRYHSGWSTDDYPSGFIGGAPDHYAEMNWSPIARDFVLRKGYMQIPPTRAKFWKFEFCGLVPEPYEVYKPVQRLVQTFTTDMWGNVSAPTATLTSTSPLTQGLSQVYAVNSTVLSLFDSGQSTNAGTGSIALGLNPTAARVIWDSTSRTNVGAIYWAWNFLPLTSPSVAPSFTSVGKHAYEQIEVVQQTKIAYFIGLVTLGAYRLDALATDDTERYVDNFFDLTNVAEATNWTLEADHQLSSGDSHYSIAQSEPFSSNRIVTAVQFATQQSDAMQVLPDDDFNDPSHASWAVVGDAILTPGVVTDVGVGTTLRVSRESASLTWDLINSSYPEWTNITTPNLSFGMLEEALENPMLSGGVTSAAISTPAGGRVSVAGRVVAANTLSEPLWVQVVDDVTGDILAEESIDVQANRVTEWYASYTIGDVSTPPWRWEDFFSTVRFSPMVDIFTGANATPLPAMDTGQLWSYDFDSSGNPLSLSIVSNAATVVTVGDHNYVDTKDIWGTLEFSIGTMGTADTNLAPNPSFETNVTGWSVTNSGTITRVSGGTVGSFSAQVKATQATMGTTMSPTVNITGIVAGTTYDFSGDVNSSRTATFNLTINWFNSSGGLVSQVIQPFSLTATTWTHLETMATAPAGATQVLCLFDGTIMPVNATFNVDNVFFGVKTQTSLVNFDPFDLDDQGRLFDGSGTSFNSTNLTNVLTTNGTARAIAASDDIRIDIMPTFLVPSGKADFNHSSNQDSVVWPYSLVIYLNGTWVRTVTHDLGARSIMGIKGRLNQKFNSWSWTPFNYGQLSSPVIMYYPRLDKGNWLDSSTLTQFEDLDENVWQATGSWDLSTPAEVPYADNYGPPLTAASNGAVFSVDTGVWYGSMSTFVRNIASGTSSTLHGNVLCLDFDSGIYINYLGQIVSGATVYATLFPGGISANSAISVTWAQTARVSSTTRGAINATTFPDMLIAKVNGVIVGTYATSLLQTWRGTKRGLAGDVYNGTRPTAADYTLDTSFRSFHWAPDASQIAVDPTSPVWDNVTQHNTLTYDQITLDRALPTPQLRAQLVQYGESQDTWDIDALSMFVDPLVWSFSNDGGVTFYPAFDIRNNPNGVMSFPSSTVVTSLGRQPGTSLVWRVLSYAPDRIISNLVIRPWYAGLLSGVLRSVGLGTSGPNLMPYDDAPLISQDASFQVGSGPIPQSWSYSFRQLQAAQNGVTPSS